MSSSASLIEHASKFGTQKLYPEDKKDYYELEGVPKLSISPKPVVGDDPNQPKSVQQSRASSSARPKTSDSRAPSPRLSALPEPPSPSTRAYEITTAGSTIAGATLQQGFWQQHRLAIATSLPILYGVLELLMLAYFLDLYLTLPRTNTGGLQRISPVYSLWPYVACIGGKNVSAFAAFATIISLFFVGTFAADVALAWHTQPNYWLRRTRLVLSIVWGILFVCQAGASTNTVSHLHLYVISVKSVFSIAIKSVTWAMDYQSRKQVPLMRSDPVAMKSKRWKDIIIIFAFPIGILANLGIYACVDEKAIQTPGTSCYIIVAISAISEWTFTFVNVAFMLNVAYDIFHKEYYEELRSLDSETTKRVFSRLSDTEARA